MCSHVSVNGEKEKNGTRTPQECVSVTTNAVVPSFSGLGAG